jgi:hypothetical protein
MNLPPNFEFNFLTRVVCRKLVAACVGLRVSLFTSACGRHIRIGHSGIWPPPAPQGIDYICRPSSKPICELHQNTSTVRYHPSSGHTQQFGLSPASTANWSSPAGVSLLYISKRKTSSWHGSTAIRQPQSGLERHRNPPPAPSKISTIRSSGTPFAQVWIFL